MKTIRTERGMALVLVTVAIAVLGAVLSEFSYTTRVDLEVAANARDRLRAEYLARSAVQLGRLFIKVQQSVLDANRQFIGDVQLAEFSPYLVRAFGGDKEEREGLASLLGVDLSGLKGLGAGKGASFDLDMSAEDGLININCGGGLNDAPRQQALYAILSAMVWPPRYNRIFENADANGQFSSRDDVVRAIVDWADVDEQRFEPQGPSSAAEDYRYDVGRDAYRAHNYFYDTTGELNQVRGVTAEFWGAFGEMLTAYGSCKVNLGAVLPEHWPILAALFRATVKDDQKQNPVLLDDALLAGLAQQVLSLKQLMGGFQSTQQFVQLVSNPASLLSVLNPGGGSGGSDQQTTGLPLDLAKVNQYAYVGPRRVIRLAATGVIERSKQRKIKSRIVAIWDTQHINQNTTSIDPNDRTGTWVYFHEE